jgi:hypothetical protein
MSTLSYPPRHHMLVVPVRLGPAQLLSVAAGALAVVVSAVGLFSDLYRDNAWVTAAQRGNDIATLVVAPVMLLALLLAQSGSLRGRLVWLGGIAYLLYNYAFYLFGVAFNDAFLAYAATVSCSLWALILGLRQLDVARVARGFSSHVPVRAIAAYMLFLAVGLAGAWVSAALKFVANGTVPSIITKSGNPTSIVFALDLTVVAPALAVGAVLLWKRQAWGYVLAAILLVESVGYALALLGMSAYQAHDQISGAWGFAPFAIIFLIGGAAGSVLLLRDLDQSRVPERGQT